MLLVAEQKTGPFHHLASQTVSNRVDAGLGHPPMGLCRSSCSTTIKSPRYPTSMCWQQRENRVSDDLVSAEPMLLPVSGGVFAAQWVLGYSHGIRWVCKGRNEPPTSSVLEMMCVSAACVRPHPACGDRGLYRAEEGAMATRINGIISVGCKEERGEGWMGGLCSQVKLLGVARTDHSLGGETLMLFKAETSVYL